MDIIPVSLLSSVLQFGQRLGNFKYLLVLIILQSDLNTLIVSLYIVMV